MSGVRRSVRIACVQLSDDFSGSAKVFSHAIDELESGGATVRVTVGSGEGAGFIRSAHRVRTVFYRYTECRALLLANFLIAQVLIFLDVLWGCLFWKADLVYVNTILAPGALAAGRLCRRKVVLHLHEVGLGSHSLFAVLLPVSCGFSDRIICVSEYMRIALKLPSEKTYVVHNSLRKGEWATAQAIALRQSMDAPGPFTVLMACSLKWYKGIDSFLLLAKRLETGVGEVGRSVRFRLLLNCGRDEWSRFCTQNEIPGNVLAVLRPPDVWEHYAQASLVVNLSHKDGWVETFGMTLLEGMTCGIPVISPTVGGCTELFVDGSGGWQIDSRDIGTLTDVICRLATDRAAWLEASRSAAARAAEFSPGRFSRSLHSAFFR